MLVLVPLKFCAAWISAFHAASEWEWLFSQLGSFSEPTFLRSSPHTFYRNVRSLPEKWAPLGSRTHQSQAPHSFHLPCTCRTLHIKMASDYAVLVNYWCILSCVSLYRHYAFIKNAGTLPFGSSRRISFKLFSRFMGLIKFNGINLLHPSLLLLHCVGLNL